MNKFIKFALVSFAAYAGSFLLAGQVYATNVSVRLEQPKSPTNQNDFPVHFVALDLLGRTVSVSCARSYNGGASSAIGGSQTFSDGGGSGSCTTGGSVINSGSGTYTFTVTATAGSDSASESVNVVYDTSGPGDVYAYSKDHNACQYTIHFSTANDSGATVKVELYRSDSVPFTADTSTRTQTIAAGSNEVHSVNDTPPDCSKTYYYAVRAFDSAGNASALVGDSVTNVTVITPTPGGSSGAIPVSSTNGNVLGTQTGKESTTGAKESGGQVEGTSSQSAEKTTSPTPAATQPYYLAHPKRALAIAGGILLVGGAALYVFWSRRKNQTNP